MQALRYTKTAGTRLAAPALPARAVSCKATKEDASPSDNQQRLLQKAALVSVAAVSPSLIFAEAFADELVSERGPTILGLPVGEVVLLMAPVILYAIFTIYRTAINPQVKLGDFFFALAATVIFGNIIAIIFFKIRFF